MFFKLEENTLGKIACYECFQRLALQTRKNHGLFCKGLKSTLVHSKEFISCFVSYNCANVNLLLNFLVKSTFILILLHTLSINSCCGKCRARLVRSYVHFYLSPRPPPLALSLISVNENPVQCHLASRNLFL